MNELAGDFMPGLVIGLIFCIVLTIVGWRRARCRFCHGTGSYEATESFEHYDVVRSVRCPRHCAVRP